MPPQDIPREGFFESKSITRLKSQDITKSSELLGREFAMAIEYAR
jgi:hypothetical protein